MFRIQKKVTTYYIHGNSEHPKHFRHRTNADPTDQCFEWFRSRYNISFQRCLPPKTKAMMLWSTGQVRPGSWHREKPTPKKKVPWVLQVIPNGLGRCRFIIGDMIGSTTFAIESYGIHPDPVYSWIFHSSASIGLLRIGGNDRSQSCWWQSQF